MDRSNPDRVLTLVNRHGIGFSDNQVDSLYRRIGRRLCELASTAELRELADACIDTEYALRDVRASDPASPLHDIVMLHGDAAFAALDDMIDALIAGR